jgi:hypothetical protein
VIVCLSLHSHSETLESLASPVTARSEVGHVSTSIKQISCEERPFANRRETVQRVVCFSHVNNMNVSSRTVKTVLRTKRSGMSAI